MRKMINESGTVLKVEEHIITSNFWEFYIVADEEGGEPNPDVKFALVMGDNTELGDVYLPEIEPYIITRTSDLATGVAPAAGYRWQDDEPVSAYPVQYGSVK